MLCLAGYLETIHSVSALAGRLAGPAVFANYAVASVGGQAKAAAFAGTQAGSAALAAELGESLPAVVA